MMRLALYQPEIPQNTGTLLRLGACLGVGIDIIEPCGFPLSDARMRRAGMDYIELANYKRYASWQVFKEQTEGRVVLLTPRADLSFLDFHFDPQDVLLLGRESDGVPKEVLADMPHQVRIPMQPGRRSLNVALAASIVLGESLRQTHLWPESC